LDSYDFGMKLLEDRTPRVGKATMEG
jgi:hypothetical protein